MSSRLLFERFPALRSASPLVPLAQLPTPVGAQQVGEREILVKRDDLTARPYGGNKVRKLEFLLAQAIADGQGRVVTAGAFGSHHALATTVYGRRCGLQVTCVLFPQPLTAHVREVLRLIAANGAELRFTRRMEGVPFALRRARWAGRAEGACIIPPGGSNPIGALGYVEAGLELDAQIRSGVCVEPGRVYVAAGTLGTAAGLAIGLALADRPIPVHAVRITSSLVTNRRALGNLVRGTLNLLRPAASTLPTVDRIIDGIVLRHDQLGEGYGRETSAARVATAAFAGAGLVLDGTYTAKAAAALLADSTAERPALFWHTLSAFQPIPEGQAPDLARLPEPFRTILASPSDPPG